MRSIVDGLPYAVIVTAHAPDEVARALRGREAAAIVADRRVGARAEAIRDAVQAAGIDFRGLLTLAAGERHKNARTLAAVYRWLVEQRVDRETVLIAVGGGTLTDVIGYAAATYQRGIPWLPVATTVLGMVDAAIGGKTGIDLAEGKNLVGAFWQPLAVIADLDALTTLPLPQRRAGLAEVVKAAVIGQPSLLESVRKQKLRAAGPSWSELIQSAAAVKVRVVAQDPIDRGARATLNLGHTTAHAIETVSNYRVAHGEAVSVGLRVAGVLARDRTGWPLSDHERMLRSLQHARLPLTVPPLPIDELVAAARADKKRRSGAARFVLPVRLGEVTTNVGVSDEDFAAALHAAQQSPADGW